MDARKALLFSPDFFPGDMEEGTAVWSQTFFSADLKEDPAVQSQIFYFQRMQGGRCCSIPIFFQWIWKRVLLSDLEIFFSVHVEDVAAV